MTQIFTQIPQEQTHLLWFNGWEDAPLCPCGNDVTSEGFVGLNEDNEFTWLGIENNTTSTRILCLSCRSIFKNMDLDHISLSAGMEDAIWVDFSSNEESGRYLMTFPTPALAR